MRPPPSASTPTWTSQPPAAAPPASPWHSPVPYLFGGLAAMLGLITLALLILVCSYWRLNSDLGGAGDPGSSSGADAAGGGDGSKSPAVADLIAVVMAGDKTPTFLAAPIVRRATVNGASAVPARQGSMADGEEDRGKDGVA